MANSFFNHTTSTFGEPSKFHVHTDWFTKHDLAVFVESLETISRLQRERYERKLRRKERKNSMDFIQKISALRLSDPPSPTQSRITTQYCCTADSDTVIEPLMPSDFNDTTAFAPCTAHSDTIIDPLLPEDFDTIEDRSRINEADEALDEAFIQLETKYISSDADKKSIAEYPCMTKDKMSRTTDGKRSPTSSDQISSTTSGKVSPTQSSLNNFDEEAYFSAPSSEQTSPRSSKAFSGNQKSDSEESGVFGTVTESQTIYKKNGKKHTRRSRIFQLILKRDSVTTSRDKELQKRMKIEEKIRRAEEKFIKAEQKRAKRRDRLIDNLLKRSMSSLAKSPKSRARRGGVAFEEGSAEERFLSRALRYMSL